MIAVLLFVKRRSIRYWVETKISQKSTSQTPVVLQPTQSKLGMVTMAKGSTSSIASSSPTPLLYPPQYSHNSSQNTSMPSSIESISTKQTHQLNFEELKDMKMIGKGSYGMVYSATWRQTKVAVKKLFDENGTGFADFEREAALLASLRPHPNVIMFIGITWKPQPLTIVTEFCNGGSLHQLIHSEYDIPVEIQLKILLGIARGMLHLHSENMIHRDLAARNILLTESYSAKVADFGLSRLLDMSDIHNTKADVGPLRWMAPESIQNKVFSKKSDVFSFGITMWELFARYEVHASLSGVDVAMKVVYEELRPEIPQSLSPELKEVMQKCWAQHADSRPLFTQVCNEINAFVVKSGIAVEQELATEFADDEGTWNSTQQ